MAKPPPAAPTHLLRSHQTAVSALSISNDNERIYSGDASGRVVVTSTRSLRPIAVWSAHTDSVLGVEEFGANILTHGRDNKLHVWNRVEEGPSSARLGGSAALPSLPTPTLAYSMDVNALNYCRFSLLPFDTATQTGESAALIALPNLVDSSVADIWSLPKCDRLHAAIGQESNQPIFLTKPSTGRGSCGIVMSLHLFRQSEGAGTSSFASSATSLRLLCAYENGSVALRGYTRADRPMSIEGQGWEVLWTSKLHVETIMAMAVSKANTFALTVSADHLVGRYELSQSDPPTKANTSVHRMKHPGNSSVAIRDDGKVCAVGGWDGSVRLFSTKSFKPLGTLRYHKVACQCLGFAHHIEADASDDHDNSDENDDDDEEMSPSDKADRSRWLVAGGKDNRVSIWSLISFESGPPQP